LVLVFFLAFAGIRIDFIFGTKVIGFFAIDRVALFLGIVLFLHAVLRVVAWFGEVCVAVFLDGALIAMVDLLREVRGVVGLAWAVLSYGSHGVVWIFCVRFHRVVILNRHTRTDVSGERGVASCDFWVARFRHF